MTFAEQLKSERQRLGRNQADAAALFQGLTIGTLRAWESGRNEPPEWSRALILDFLRGQKPAKESTFVERGRPPLKD